ncbi:MFS transporter [Actinosynnema sp. NPDC047251]|uniref:Putative transporter n=1 Tax=Saccharothrix espanaensis (strain ATCC 51144 / DSM 44229 / JCM 9112 / NBRC 15066 / NRRL 15764) TaxID=1179773 RepID=K0K337_SACES|nr:MFS transporter [Saccharothrix espanaensis]CCH31299.1 putative transporter [Saccharothrix espanaensis DSM 44229]
MERNGMRWALVAMLAAAAMDLIDTTIVTVAAPAIRADLAASAAEVEWSVAGYALAFGVGLVAGARTGDRFGRRPVFLAGVAGFVLASLACGLAPGPGVLVSARVVQGLAAAVMIPQVLTVIQVSVPRARRAGAFAAYGATAAIGTVSGPLLGGLLVEADLLGLGWRSVFLVNVPIGVLAFAVAALTLPDSRAPRARRLDVVGTVLLAAGLLLVLHPVAQGPRLGWPWWAVALPFCSVAVVAAFVAWQRRAPSPLVPLSLFRLHGFVGGACAQIALYAGVTGFFLVLAVELQTVHGFSAWGTGLTFVAWSAGIAVASAFSGRLAARWGRRLTVAGALVMCLGMIGLLVANGPVIGAADLVPGLFVAGLGMGLVAPTLVEVSLREVDLAHAGAASGVVATAGQLGGALGVVGLGAVHLVTGDLAAVLWCEVALFASVAVFLSAASRTRVA